MVRLIELTPETPAEETQGNGTLAFLAALAKVGVSNAVTNLTAKVGAVMGNGITLPFAVPVDSGGPCYLASFTRMYMDGATNVLGESKNTLLRTVAPAAAVCGRAARGLGMDDIVTLNNNLHPTSHVPDWRCVDVGEVTAALVAAYPRHPIWVRGLNDHMNAAELSRLKAQGYVLAPSRPVEIFDPTAPTWRTRKDVKRDLKTLGSLPGMKAFAAGPFSAADFEAMARTGRSATVDRHTILLPHYSDVFFRACAQWPDYRFFGLRDDDGAIRAFITVVDGPERITTGTMGYETNEEHAHLHYRVTSIMAMQHAIETQRPYNLGFGAVAFKRSRGTVPAMEMNAFYIRHLPAMKRSLWQTTLSAMSQLAGAVIKRL